MSENNFNKVDFIGIGMPRCATTWIYECLKEHPDICMSSEKETEFFSNYYEKGLDYYQSFFDCKNKKQLKGEFTPHYIWQDKEVIKRIKNHNSDIKLIVSLRNPVERLFSSYQYLKAQGEKQSLVSFEEALEQGLMEDKVKYYEELQRWLEEFPREKVLILFFEDIKKDPKAFIQDIYRFLEVDEDFEPKKLHQKSNPRGSERPKLNFLNKITARIELFFRKNFSSGHLKRFKKIRLFKWCRESLLWIKNKNRKRVKDDRSRAKEIDSSVEKKLYHEFRRDVNKLEELTGRNLSHWKNA